METVPELDDEEQVIIGKTQEEEEKEDDQDLTTLEQGLSDMSIVSAPKELVLNQEATELCPESYRINSPKEIQLLAMAENFQRQYSYLYPERKPLLLCPINECGVKKFVSTTLRPTSPVHPELFTWEGCASFVADFLSLEPLDPPVELPRYLPSSTSVLQSQRGTCFEFSTLLCSLLLGAHYDAYCVSGYAVREMCLLDQSLQEFPLLDTADETVIPEKQTNKYSMRKVREAKSRFMEDQAQKKQDAKAALLQKEMLLEDQRREQRSADPMRGIRVHCWVLILSGSRDVQKNFFIDALTGNSYATDSNNFLGVESVWNNFNYYVNMQNCSTGCAGMVYDLEDIQMWEPFLYGATSKKQLLLEVLKRKDAREVPKRSSSDDEEKEDEKEQPPLRAFDMPRSWVSSISISRKDLENRWPGGQKVTRYRKAKLETFAPYMRPDGLVTRLTTYRDIDCTEVVLVKESYRHRGDLLERREFSVIDGSTKQYFRIGRCLNLINLRQTDSECVMEFSGFRADGLVRRVESASEMTEIFEDRTDFLRYRHVGFDDKPPVSENNPLQIHKVVEYFHRNRSKPANKDVAERVFLLAERCIEVTYHLEDFRYIPSKMSFTKPRVSMETGKADNFSLDLVSVFQVDPSEEPPGILTLYLMLQELMKDEEKVLIEIQESKKEVRDILASRRQEDTDIELIFCPWTTIGAAKAQHQRQEMERMAAEEQRWMREKEEDILAPFLIRLDVAEILTIKDAKQLYQNCLDDFKKGLEKRRSLIQERYDKETQELHKEQQLYRKKQPFMTKEQEEQYQTYYSEKSLLIRTTKARLNMLEKAAPLQLHNVEQKLKLDPRLSPHLL
ncbi:dynein regulatory complex subunit 7 [Antennarius striatus]|uniref:dynein regulatory complex subunit 7 n=1 Tax=Antennarius striatus TaxID=241820 RepID=UPI0035B18C9E